MTTVVGNVKQETKIKELGELAAGMFPSRDLLAVKGALRLAITRSLAQTGLSAWREVAGQPVATRRQFFGRILANAAPGLRGQGWSDEEIARVCQAWDKANQKYLVD